MTRPPSTRDGVVRLTCGRLLSTKRVELGPRQEVWASPPIRPSRGIGCRFPLPFIPQADYHKPIGGRQTHRRYFGAPRDGGRRLHAGCDLLAPLGTEIYAVDDGTVVEFNPSFYHGTGFIALAHPGGYVARYCEVLASSIKDIERNQRFKAGDVIAKVGKMLTMSMLHFELYAGTLSGRLTVHSDKKYKRRGDLVDPTAFLDGLRPYAGASHVAVPILACYPPPPPPSLQRRVRMGRV